MPSPRPLARARRLSRSLSVSAVVLLAFGSAAVTATPASAAGSPNATGTTPRPASTSLAPNTDRDRDLEVDDTNMMRLVMNADRARRIRAAAQDALESQSDKLRDLERAILASPTVVAPTSGVVTQWYGSHPGVDIAPPYGTPVVAAHSGVVTFVGWQDGYGMHVEVSQADGYVTTYSHMSAFTVAVGQLVVAGQQVGNVGSTGWSTGPHLHFEVHLPSGERTDPALWLRWHKVVLTAEPDLGPEPLP